jgi:5-methylcytosine-specific restriction enzyme subunit McrC
MRAEPRVLQLEEWARQESVPLSSEEVRVLRESGARLRIVATGRSGLYDVETSHFVGTIVGPSLRVLIRPKLPIDRLLFLLSAVAEVPELTGPAVLERAPDLLEAMQWLFAEALSTALGRGLVFGYRATSETTQALRGRPDVGAIALRRYGLIPPIDCTFDEYTPDTEANRRLLAATQLLARASTRRPEVAETLRRLALRFEGVADRRYGPQDPPYEIRDRRLEPFRTVLALAELALRNASVELYNGRTDAVGFLVNMDALFERFVVASLRSTLGLRQQQWRHHPSGLRLDERGAIAVTPDALWTDSQGRPRLPVDVKYKSTMRGENPDIYQMVAYCTALGVRDGVILYANAQEQRVHSIANTPIRIHVIELNPAGDLVRLRSQIAEVASRLAELVEGAPLAA